MADDLAEQIIGAAIEVHRALGPGLLVEGEVVVEVKCVRLLPEVATAQVLSYLKATGGKRALLISFGEERLVEGVKRISL